MSENETFEVSLDPEACNSSLSEVFQKTLGIDVHEANDKLHLDVRNRGGVDDYLDQSKVAQHAFDYSDTLLAIREEAGLQKHDMPISYVNPDLANDSEHLDKSSVEVGTLGISVEDATSPEGLKFLMQAEASSDLLRMARWDNASVTNFRNMDPSFYRECLLITPVEEALPAPAETAKAFTPIS